MTTDVRSHIICMAYGMDSIEGWCAQSCLAFNDYMTAFRAAPEWLNPADPNRPGLTLNSALFYRGVLGWDQHACHLSKFGLDEAVRFISVFPEYEVSENASSALSIFKGHLISWTSRSWDLPSILRLHHFTLTYIHPGTI